MAFSVGGNLVFSVSINASGTATGAQQVTNNFKIIQGSFNKIQEGAKDTQASLDGLTNSLGALSGAFGAAAAGNAIKEFTVLAARVENLQTVLENVGAIAGLNVAEIGMLESQVKALGITTQSARESITKLAQSELDLANSTKLARIAQDTAVIAGINSSQAFERLVIAVQRGDSRLLRNLGIVVNLAQVYQDYARSVGRTVNTLTPLEKRQLILNEVFKKGALIAGTYEASLNDVFKRFTTLERFVEEAQRAIGEGFLPAFDLYVTKATEFAKLVADNKPIARLTGDILTFATALGTAAAALGIFKLAMLGVGAAGGPITLVVLGLSYLVTAFQDSSAAAEQARISIEGVAQASREFVQSQANATKAVEGLTKLLEIPSANRTEKDLVDIRVALEELINALPKTATIRTTLENILGSGDFSSLDRALIGVERLSVSLEDIKAKQEGAAYSLKELAKIYAFTYNVSLQDAETHLKEQIRLTGQLADAAASLRKDVATTDIETLRAELDASTARADREDADLLEELGINAVSPDIVDNLASSFASLTAQVEQIQQVQVESGFDDLKKLVDNTETVAEQARVTIKLVETERRQIYKDTNVEILHDFQGFVNKQEALRLIDLENIRKYFKQLGEIQNLEKDRQEKEALRAATTKEARDNISLTFDKARRALAKQLGEDEKKLIDDLADAHKGLADAVDLANFRMEAEAVRIEDLEKQVESLEKGIDIDLVRAQKRFSKETEKTTQSLKELERLIAKLAQEKVGTLGNEVEQDRINKQLAVAGKLRAQLLKEQTLNERKFVAETLEERRKKLEQIAEQEESALKRIDELRGTTSLRFLDSVKKLADAQKKAREEVEKFAGEQQRALADPTGNTEKLFKLVDEFRENIQKARPDQIDIIKKVFPAASQQVLKDIEKSFQKLERRFQRFSEDRDERIAAINLEAAETFQNLLATSGEAIATQRAERQRKRALEDLETERLELEEENSNLQKSKTEVAKIKATGEQAINSELRNRTTLLYREAALGQSEEAVQERLKELTSEQVAKAQEHLTHAENLRKAYEGMAEASNKLLENSQKLTGGTSKITPPVTPTETPLSPEEQAVVDSNKAAEKRKTDQLNQQAKPRTGTNAQGLYTRGGPLVDVGGRMVSQEYLNSPAGKRFQESVDKQAAKNASLDAFLSQEAPPLEPGKQSAEDVLQDYLTGRKRKNQGTQEKPYGRSETFIDENALTSRGEEAAKAELASMVEEGVRGTAAKQQLFSAVVDLIGVVGAGGVETAAQTEALAQFVKRQTEAYERAFGSKSRTATR